jgi:hypothetical protein
MKKLQGIALVALIILGLSGCEKLQVQNDASADVFVKAIRNAQGTTVYAPVHSVFSYNLMSSVSVKSPDGSTLQLTNFENAGNSFFNEPAETDYLTTPPSTGTYTYTVKFDDNEEKTFTNSLSASVLAPPNITSLAKSANGDSVYIKWDAIINTHAYQLKIMNGDTQVFYQPGFADNSVPLKTSLKLGFLLSSLTTSGSGTYTFELSGLLFETTAYDYIQAISTSKKDIDL